MRLRQPVRRRAKKPRKLGVKRTAKLVWCSKGRAMNARNQVDVDIALHDRLHRGRVNVGQVGEILLQIAIALSVNF